MATKSRSGPWRSKMFGAVWQEPGRAAAEAWWDDVSYGTKRDWSLRADCILDSEPPSAWDRQLLPESMRAAFENYRQEAGFNPEGYVRGALRRICELSIAEAIV